jgi:putative hemin transport protein
MEKKSYSHLSEEWENLKAQKPGIRIKEAADMLQVAEAQLLVTKCGENVKRLNHHPIAILNAISEVDEVMALTRNASVVIETNGKYPTFLLEDHWLVGNNDDFHIIFDTTIITHIFAVTDEFGGQTRNSIQFFDAAGKAIHKIYFDPSVPEEAYTSITHTFLSPNQEKEINCLSYPKATRVEISKEIALQKWESLKNYHRFDNLEFYLGNSLLDIVTRLGEDLARKIPTDASTQLLLGLANKDISISYIVKNMGCTQLFRGPVRNVFVKDDWFNVKDPDFNLHILKTQLDTGYLVHVPLINNHRLALLFFNKQGELALEITSTGENFYSLLKSLGYYF